MDKYRLDPQFGISVDYWSNSMQTFVICDNLFSQGEQGASDDIEMNDCLNSSHIIGEEDFMVNDKDVACLFLRFKNCTGNIIILSSEDANNSVDQS